MTAKAAQTPQTDSAATAQVMRALDDIERRRAKNKVTVLRSKLSKAIDDPDVAARLARHIQALLRQED